MSVHKKDKKNRKRLLRLNDQMSLLLGKIVIVLIVILICAQGALQNESVRHLLSRADRWEGETLR